MKLVSASNHVLKTVAIEAAKDTDLSQILDDMWSLMYSKNGIGLAAPQVGLAVRLIVIHAGSFKQEIINPVITKKYNGKAKSVEGCLSFPGKQVKKYRYKRIVIEGFDANWNPVKFNLKGMAAFCAQHEVDHLNGITI